MMEPIGPDVVNDLIKTMPEGKGLNFGINENDDLTISLLEIDQLIEWGKEEHSVHIVSLATRAGADYFYNYLEQTYFTPCTPANNEYRWAIFRWNGLPWCICSIPAHKKECADKAAKAAKMKLVDGVPFIIGGIATIVASTRRNRIVEVFQPKEFEELEKDIKWFPLCSDSTYTLENQSDSPIYGGPGGRQDAEIESEFKLKQLYDKMDLSWPPFERGQNNED